MTRPKVKVSSVIFFAVLIGGCGSAAISEGDPLWKVPIVSKSKCNSIDGRYFDQGMLSEQLYDSSSFPGRQKFSHAIDSRSPPYAQFSGKEYVGARREFNLKATTKIKSTATTWEVSLFGGDGLLYEKFHILKEMEAVGCDANGRVVLRKFSLIQGGEGGAGSAHAVEVFFRKLNDGTLELRRLDRSWVHAMNHQPKKETDTTLLFFPAP